MNILRHPGPPKDDVTVEESSYTIHVCERCGTDGHDWTNPGAELVQRLAPQSARRGFRLAPVRCMAGCSRPLVVGFTAPNKASYLFGDIDPARDAEALLAFGGLYARLEDGWCNEGARPGGLRGKTLARIPRAGGWAR